MTAPRIQVSLQEDPPLIHLSRRGEVPEAFWLRIRSEFGLEGKVTPNLVSLSPEIFLVNRRLLRAVCQEYAVGIDADDGARALLSQVEGERLRLQEVLRVAPALNEEEVRQRLSDTRFRRPLTDFQIRDIGKLMALPHGANFSVPGAGKTTVAYGLYEAERCFGRVDRLLVVGPISSFEAWESEADECFLPPVPPVVRYDGSRIPAYAEVLLITYQRLAGHHDRIAAWARSHRLHIILDEAHRMKKGRLGQWGKSCLDLAYTAQRRDILTGTPAPQSPADLEALLDFLWPTLGHTFIPEEARMVAPPPELTRSIARQIRPLYVRTRKREIRLPETVRIPERIKLVGLQLEIYQALCDQYKGKLCLKGQDRISLAAMGRIVMYLLEAASNPALLMAGSSRDDHISFSHPPLEIPKDSALYDLVRDYSAYEMPRKFLRVRDIIQSNAERNRKTLVWTNFVRNITTLKRELSEFNPAIVHGGVKPAGPPQTLTRESELDRFRRDQDCCVLLANPASTGEGISLHKICHDAVYLERTFNAGQYLQSVDRIHRLGLRADEEVRITFLMTEATIDDVVDRRVREKLAALGSLLDDPDIVTMSLPDEEDYGEVFDVEDWDKVVSHVRGLPDDGE